MPPPKTTMTTVAGKSAAQLRCIPYWKRRIFRLVMLVFRDSNSNNNTNNHRQHPKSRWVWHKNLFLGQAFTAPWRSNQITAAGWAGKKPVGLLAVGVETQFLWAIFSSTFWKHTVLKLREVFFLPSYIKYGIFSWEISEVSRMYWSILRSFHPEKLGKINIATENPPWK